MTTQTNALHSFQIKVVAIPNPFVKHKNYFEIFEINAESKTDAKQEALSRFGDFSKIEYCKEFSLDNPPSYEHFDCE